MRDIVFPNGNEKEFIKMAQKLGYAELVFVYDDHKDFFDGKTILKVENALLSKPNKIESASGKTKIVLVKSSDQDRAVIEHRRPDIIFDFEQSPKYDALHQRASGLNHILARLCAKNNISVGFRFKSLLESKPERKAVLMGRIKQNIMLCRKAGAKMVLASFAAQPSEMRNPSDLISLFTTIGMHPSEAKKALF